MTTDEVVNTLVGIYKMHRKSTGTVSEHTKSAQAITREWQDQLARAGFKKEVAVSTDNNEAIDLVDQDNQIAYELKVSGKNPHHEFFKDIFKVLTYNHNNRGEKSLKKFVFVTEKAGVEKLERRLDPNLLVMIKETHGLEVVLRAVPEE
jgi:hypothetical protein